MNEPKVCCHGASQPSDAMATDPVCGMKMNPHTAKQHAEHAGHTYYFCG